MKKMILWLFWLSLPIFIIGFFLQTILIPTQDFNALSESDLLKIQQDVAINYPLGIFMLYGGLIVFAITGIFLIFYFLKSKIAFK
ncbi:hypothetical protein [Vagococcus hydrophili]|uniref:Uncharacterized protein n=1 Tax=Vagococcus hydrophili TaxID=2714947 RepID=A0A6G8AT56_9ENTE|nr:hypothetical protein [Vagococcus hydrophili]QIL48122.1 hypothetical protein G7082_06130 [Vagococcus hydrophili]